MGGKSFLNWVSDWTQSKHWLWPNVSLPTFHSWGFARLFSMYSYIWNTLFLTHRKRTTFESSQWWLVMPFVCNCSLYSPMLDDLSSGMWRHANLNQTHFIFQWILPCFPPVSSECTVPHKEYISFKTAKWLWLQFDSPMPDKQSSGGWRCQMN